MSTFQVYKYGYVERFMFHDWYDVGPLSADGRARRSPQPPPDHHAQLGPTQRVDHAQSCREGPPATWLRETAGRCMGHRKRRELATYCSSQPPHLPLLHAPSPQTTPRPPHNWHRRRHDPATHGRVAMAKRSVPADDVNAADPKRPRDAAADPAAPFPIVSHNCIPCLKGQGGKH